MSEINTKYSIEFGTQTISYDLTFQDRKTLGIRVFPDCSVKVIAPFETTDEKVLAKLKEKAPWILKQQRDFLSYHPLTPERRYVSGETHLYLGRQYKLRIEEGSKDEIKLYRGKILLIKKANSVAKNILNIWYKEKANYHFKECFQNVLPLFKKYNLNVPQFTIRKMSTRWGSCTPNGKIILNPELIKASKGCIEYVIIHELCHLVHHNHTRAFYEVQESIMPDWKKWKERLERMLV